MAPSQPQPEINGHTHRPEAVGILTRTLIQSPVTHWLLHGRIRHRSFNDVLFVGDDIVHVREIGANGHLEHIATKDDFDAHIRAAAVLCIDTDAQDEEDFLVKQEPLWGDSADRIVPSDLLVLTLDTNELVFLYLDISNAESPIFIQQSPPLPTFDRTLFQPGEHLAIDDAARAMAVAAFQREVIVYSLKTKAEILEQIRSRDPNWCPIALKHALQVDGIIRHVEFLIPPDSDSDHVLLLLVIVDERRTKAVLVDWHYSSGLQHRQQHQPQPLFPARSVSSLLIPLRNANFLIVTGEDIRRYKDISTGSIDGQTLHSLTTRDPQDAGISPQRPIYTSWCRPVRNKAARRDKDHLYLVREDGQVELLVANVDGTMSSTSAGHLQCHVGRAFASVGTDRTPDIFAVAGETSTGRVISIGQFPSSTGRVEELGWLETMSMELIETIPNWASATDMITSRLPQSHARPSRSRDGIFVTSGKQPYGTVTELRHGLEVRLSGIVELPDELPGVTAIWIVPMPTSTSLLLFMTTPNTTLCFECDETLGLSHRDEQEASAFDLGHRTLAAAITQGGTIVQVTEKAIVETLSLAQNFEDTSTFPCDEGVRYICADIDVINSRAITVEESRSGHALCSRACGLSNDETSEGVSATVLRTELLCPVLALATTHLDTLSLAAVATSDSELLISFISDADIREAARITLPAADGEAALCDHLMVLRSEHSGELLLVGGTRDGRLLTAVLRPDASGTVTCIDRHAVPCGTSAVKLMSLLDHPSTACMTVGIDTCLLSWDGQSARSLSIQSMWLADKADPTLAQSTISAISRFPSLDFAVSPLSGSLAMVSGKELLFGDLQTKPAAVPRHLPISGTPNRLIYAEQLRSIVVASLHCRVREFASPSGPEERRQIWPVIDFIPSRGLEPSCSHDMQPGERVFALLEWSYVQDGRTYPFVLVGGSYIKRNGSQGGRVTYLRPGLEKWSVNNVQEEKVVRFDAPVYALSLYDTLTYVVCYGRHVCLYRFSATERRWAELCSPYALANPGTHISTNAPLIYISTLEDSIITLRLDISPAAIGADQADQGGATATLHPVASSPCADRSLSHLVLPISESGETDDGKSSISLVSTRDRQIVGLTARSPTAEQSINTTGEQILFRAHMLRSLTRLRKTSIRPKWKDKDVEGIKFDDIVGVASDGALVGIAILEENLWKRLSWLQRLCEWSELISPHSCQDPLYDAADTGHARDERALPAGLARANVHEVMLRTSIEQEADRHIDGNVLARLLQRGGGATLKHIMREIANRDDHIGEWMAQHLEEEMAMADQAMAQLKLLLERWI